MRTYTCMHACKRYTNVYMYEQASKQAGNQGPIYVERTEVRTEQNRTGRQAKQANSKGW